MNEREKEPNFFTAQKAYRIAMYHCRPDSITRYFASLHPYWAYSYARDVDLGPSELTKAGVTGSEFEAPFRHYFGDNIGIPNVEGYEYL